MNASSTSLAEERSQINLELVSPQKENELHTPCSGRISCSRSCARSRTPTVILFFRSAYEAPIQYKPRQPCLPKSTYNVRSHVERNTHSARPKIDPPGKASVPHNLGKCIAERRVPCKPLLVHASQHRHHHIRIVVDVDFALVVVQTMQAADVLLQRTFPRNRHCKKKRIKTWIVKSLAEVTSGSQNHARFIARNGC